MIERIKIFSKIFTASKYFSIQKRYYGLKIDISYNNPYYRETSFKIKTRVPFFIGYNPKLPYNKFIYNIDRRFKI